MPQRLARLVQLQFPCWQVVCAGQDMITRLGVRALAIWVIQRMSCSLYCKFCTVQNAGLDVRALTLLSNFRLPLVREFLLLHGVCDVSKKTCLSILSRSVVCVCVGVCVCV